jgi:hypothetical protein
MKVNRLLLKCRYPTRSSLPSPPLSLNGSNVNLNSHGDEVIDGSEALIQGLAASAAEGQLCHTRVSSLIVQHKPQFDEMVKTFYSSYHKWSQ